MMPPTLLPGTSIKFSLCEQSAKPIRHPKQNLCPVADKKLIGFTLHMMINADFHFFLVFFMRFHFTYLLTLMHFHPVQTDL
jgi:hypothetical protein